MWWRLLLDPDPAGNGGGLPGAGAGDVGAGTVGTSGGTDAGATASPDSGGGQTGLPATESGGGGLEHGGSASSASEGASQATWQGIRDAARELGYDLSQFRDDAQAFQYLINQARRAQEANYYAQVGQQILPHASEFQEYLRSRQQQGQSQEQKRPEWQPPEFDERWLGLVDQDPATGLYVGKPGVPPEIARRVNEFAEWQRKFRNDPLGMINRGIEERVGSLVEQRVKEALQAHQAQSAIDSIIQRNSQWLYQKDANGRPLVGLDGRLVPTPEGARYAAHVRNLQQAGVSDPSTLDSLAQQLLRAEIAIQQQTNGGTTQTQTALASSRTQVNPLQARPPGERQATPGATEPGTEGLSLAEMMRRDLEAAGINDAELQRQIAG